MFSHNYRCSVKRAIGFLWTLVKRFFMFSQKSSQQYDKPIPFVSHEFCGLQDVTHVALIEEFQLHG
jgi:hypothetical protein